jgi:hypothetical protein
MTTTEPTRADSRLSGTNPIVTRLLAKYLWSSPAPGQTMAETVARQKRSYLRATMIVRAYYVVSVYWVVSVIGNWPGFLRAKAVDPLWPAHWWFHHVSIITGVNIIFCAYLFTSLIVMLVPQQRWARILYAIALLQYMAFINTPDKVNHDLHGWLFVSIIFIFLPRGPWNERRRIADRQFFLMVFWAATLVVLFFYTLTGFWKIHDGLTGFVQGRINGFDLSGFSYIVGNRLLQTNQDTLLGVFFTRNALPGWFLFTGTMYLETSSVIVAFRPRLYRLWGLALIFFHVGTYVAMGFTFPENIPLVGLLLVCSPLAPDTIAFKETVLDLPVVHVVSGRIAALRNRRPSPGEPAETDDPTEEATSEPTGEAAAAP